MATTSKTVTVSSLADITGTSKAENILITASVSGSVNLGGGNDSLTLAGDVNRLTLTNVETISGGAGDDDITLAASQKAVLDLVRATMS